ncbi:hypothetical protein G7Y89_g12627 [Cudoniella acicularis]|uniref:Enoyl reductase (ER) domain-containing protein n=1 Tax=Cudoniella acicularis TaxID=354080 RepID=A0A8H4VWS9_9HELO|nr:hypothetical protein G7Y89_g12627 [Cudoniella acicularis]
MILTPPNLAAPLLLTNFVLAYLVLASRTIKQIYGIDNNVSPREDIAKYGPEAVKSGKITQAQLDRIKRADGAHYNSIENFTVLVASSLIAVHAGVPAQTVNGLMAAYTLSRVGYAIAYITISSKKLSLIRSTFFWVGNISCISLFVAAWRRTQPPIRWLPPASISSIHTLAMASTMRALGFPTFGKTHKLELVTVPIPEIKTPNDILVKIHAFSLSQSDAVRARGFSRPLESITLPFIVGSDYAGTISALGTSVTDFQIGDRVYGFTFPAACAAEYMLLSPSPTFKFLITKIPASLSFTQAAAITASGHTAVCALLKLDHEFQATGGLKGKTVLVPAGLGGIGSFALQLLKPVFGAKEVITTLSTGKIAKLEKFLGEGLVDRIIDYTKVKSVVDEVGRGSVDAVIDTVMITTSYLPVLKKGGVVLTMFGKTSKGMKEDWPNLPTWAGWILDFVDWGFRVWAGRSGVRYFAAFTDMGAVNGVKNAGLIEGWVAEGKFKPLVGEVVDMGGFRRSEEGV